MKPYYESDGVRLYHGDCLDVLAEMENESVDAVVTDPPAGIGFMGKEWDGSRGGRYAWIAWLQGICVELLRVLKPGGHGLVWAIPRTSHWTAMALEDAGFEIRDRVSHLFGSGFPKSRNLDGEWNGWGTALKPAVEDWWLVRKPLEGTVASNVIEYGTGAINIDGCRVGTSKNTPASPSRTTGNSLRGGVDGSLRHETGAEDGHNRNIGRWPAHLVLSHTPDCRCVGTKRVATGVAVNHNRLPETMTSWMGTRASQTGQDRGYAEADGKETVEAWECSPDCPIRLLDEQSGDLDVCGGPKQTHGSGGLYEMGSCGAPGDIYRDAGGASRFFYTAKVSRSERNLGGVENRHPTVKPLALMQWLCRLITPPGGIVLDPFAGSGSTLVAALREGFRVIGIEREAESVKTAKGRIEEDAPLFQRVRGA